MIEQLTNREQQIYDLIIGEGLNQYKLAKKLSIKPRTIEKYITQILNKYGVKNQRELIIQHYKHLIEVIINENKMD